MITVKLYIWEDGSTPLCTFCAQQLLHGMHTAACGQCHGCNISSKELHVEATPPQPLAGSGSSAVASAALQPPANSGGHGRGAAGALGAPAGSRAPTTY